MTDAADREILVIPRDGVRQRFHAVIGGRRLHLALDRDGFAGEQPLVLSRALDRTSFTLESRAPQKHETILTVEGLPPGVYTVAVGITRRSFRAEAGRPTCIPLSVKAGGNVTVRLEPAK